MPVTQSAFGSLDAAMEAMIQAKRTLTTGATGNHTLTVGEFINGVYTVPDGGSAANIQTPTAAAIVAAIKDCAVGTEFSFILYNLDAGDSMTLTAGSGVTVEGTVTAVATKARRFDCVVTNITAASEAVLVLTTA